MRRIARSLALGLAAALGASPAAAADWYAELHAGTTRADTATTAERVEGAYGIGLGWVAHPRLALQFDWHTLGENADHAACAPAGCPRALHPEHGWALRALPRLPLGERFTLELGLGALRWEGDRSVGGRRPERHGVDPLWSLGVEWRFAERWAATVERQATPIDGASLAWTGATLRYRF